MAMDVNSIKQMLSQYQKLLGEDAYLDKYEGFVKEAKDRGLVSDFDVLRHVLNRFSIHIARARLAYRNMDKTMFEGVFLTLDATDFGAGRQYKTAKEAFEKNPQEAIAKKLVNADGVPLSQSGFNKGKPIDVDQITWQSFALLRPENKDKFEIALMTIRDELVESLPLCKALVTFEAGKKKPKEGQEFMSVGTTTFTNFTQQKPITQQEVFAMVQATMPEKIITVEDAISIADALAAAREAGDKINYNDFYAVIGNAASGTFITDDNSNSDMLRLIGILPLDAIANDEAGIPEIVAWLPKQNPKLIRRVQENATDVLVFGMPIRRIDDEGNSRYSMRALGLLVDEAYIAPEDIKPIEGTDDGQSSFN